MSQSVDIQPHSLEDILEILRSQALAMPASPTSSRYLRALLSLESSVFSLQSSDCRQARRNTVRSADTAAEAAYTEALAPILHPMLTDWLVSLWLSDTPYATASLYLDIISSLYGSAVKAGRLPKTNLFSQIKASLKTIGPNGWKSGIDDEIFTRALRLTKNAAHLISDDAIAASLVIWSLTHSLMPLTDIALLKREDFMGSGHSDRQKDTARSADTQHCGSAADTIIISRHCTNARRKYIFDLRQSERTPKQLEKHIAKIVNALFKRARLPQATDPYQTVEALWAYAALRAGIPASQLVAYLGHAPLGLPVLKLSSSSSSSSFSSLSSKESSDADNTSYCEADTARSADTEPLAPILRAQRADTYKENFAQVGKIFLENPPRWYAMSLRPGVRFTQVCRRIQLLSQTHTALRANTEPLAPILRAQRADTSLSDIKLFYPCEEIARAIGKKIVVKQRPFIHSVVFFHAKLTDIGRLFSKIGDLAWCYRQSARPGAPYADISDSQFQLFQQTIARFTPDYEVASTGELDLKPNDRVQIVGGLFAGHEATMEGRLSSLPTESEPGTRKTLKDNTARSANTAAGAADTERSADTPATPSVIYRLNIVGDNGIEWRINVDSRLLAHGK